MYIIPQIIYVKTLYGIYYKDFAMTYFSFSILYSKFLFTASSIISPANSAAFFSASSRTGLQGFMSGKTGGNSIGKRLESGSQQMRRVRVKIFT